MPELQRSWHGWRGSDEQLARAFTAMVEQARPIASCRIDVEVKDDHEVFTSPEHFRDEVTSDALRRFQSIGCSVEGADLVLRYEMAWQGPRWVPDRSALVELKVVGDDESRIALAGKAVQAAVERAAVGRWRHHVVSQALSVSMTFSGALVAGAILVLLGEPEVFSSVRGFLLLAVALVIGWYVEGILYPDLEVTRNGKSMLGRLRGFVWTLIVGLVGAGLAKLIFG